MANPWAGEVELVLDGEAHVCRLSLGMLAQLERAVGEGGVLALIRRFEEGRFSMSDVLEVLLAGLRGGGWRGEMAQLEQAQVRGGAMVATCVAAALLARAFAMPGREAPCSS